MDNLVVKIYTVCMQRSEEGKRREVRSAGGGQVVTDVGKLKLKCHVFIKSVNKKNMFTKKTDFLQPVMRHHIQLWTHIALFLSLFCRH